MSLAIITSFFNPCRYRRIRENYYRYVEALGPLSEHLYTIELVLDDDPPLDCPRVRTTIHGRRPDHFMWQKESLLNAAITSLPHNYDSFAWVDGDVLFPDSSWYDQAQEKLLKFKAIQLFEYVYMMNALGGVHQERHGLISCRKKKSHDHSAWGLAWAARRSAVPSLLDVMIAGGADVFMGKVFIGERLRNLGNATALTKIYAYWAKQVKCTKLDETSYLPIKIHHLFHGTRPDRRYMYRDTILQKHRFDPSRELVRDGAVYRWAYPDSPVSRVIREWFATRREDA